MSTMTLSSMTLSSTFADHAGTDHGPAPVRLRVVRPDEVAAGPAPAGATDPARPAHGLPGLARRRCSRSGSPWAPARSPPSSPAPRPRPAPWSWRPGDTLWGIAGELAADGEVRAMVERIERLNALDTALVQSGQRLRVPLTE